jgi:hypothetical protein
VQPFNEVKLMRPNSTARKYGLRMDQGLIAVWLGILMLSMSLPAYADWIAQGPGPNTDGQVQNITDREVVGAIHDVATHPSNARIIYVGSVNGGIWMTTTATSQSPVWRQQTDSQRSLSIGAIEFDPTDPNNQTLVAGIGRFSNYGLRGGRRRGLLRTTDGGMSWVPLNGGGALSGLNVSGVAPRGAIIVISVNTTSTSTSNTFAGIWRSTDTGTTWAQISGEVGTGLPAGGSFDLVGDPRDQTRLFTNAGSAGLFLSKDTGATWTKISQAFMDGMLANASNIEIAVGTNNNLYVAVVEPNPNNPGDSLTDLFRSGDGGSNWTSMGVPTTASVGIHPGGQGKKNLSIVADPNDDNIVYIGGDTQEGPFPNSVGATGFTGRLFRGDASLPAANRFFHLTHSNSMGPAGGGTASNSAPHADSRDMAFAANGDLIEVDDGGIYRRTDPQTNTGDWFSMNGDLPANG